MIQNQFRVLVTCPKTENSQQSELHIYIYLYWACAHMLYACHPIFLPWYIQLTAKVCHECSSQSMHHMSKQDRPTSKSAMTCIAGSEAHLAAALLFVSAACSLSRSRSAAKQWTTRMLKSQSTENGLVNFTSTSCIAKCLLAFLL